MLLKKKLTKFLKMNKTLNKIYPFTIYPLFAFPLLKENLSMIFLGVFGLLTIRNFCLNRINKKFDKRWLFFSIPFFILIISSVFRWSLLKNLGEINHALLFLVLPVFFYLSPKELFTKNKVLSYFKFLGYSSFLLILTYVVLFIINHSFNEFFATKYNSSLFRDFIYSKTVFFTIHPAYFTSILLFVTAFYIEQLKIKFNYFYVSLIVIFYIFTFLALTKLNIVLVNLLITYSIFSELKTKMAYKIIVLSSLIVLCFLLITITPGMFLRITELINSLNTEPIGVAYDSTNIRKAIYTCDFYLLNDHLFTGVGFSEIKLELLNCFESNYTSNFYKDHLYLTHNYFIYIILGCGVFGLLPIIYFFYKNYTFLFRFKSLATSIFMLNTLLMCLIEDYFYRQNGILFFLLISLSLFKFSQIENKETNLFDK